MGDTTSLSARKAALRKSVRALRRALPAAPRRRAAQRAAGVLARACRRWQVRHVALFESFTSEIDTAPAIERLRRQGCAIYVPHTFGIGQLRFVPLDSGGARPPRLDLVVVPLVAFDRRGRRLGMGGGYYDRVLARLRGRRPLRVGYAFALQEVAAVPAAAHDMPLDAIVTEQGLRRFR